MGPSAQSFPIAPQTSAQVTSHKVIAWFALLHDSVLLMVNELQISSGGHENMGTVSDGDAHAAVGSTLAVITELPVATKN